jgi:hypothetical protein
MKRIARKDKIINYFSLGALLYFIVGTNVFLLRFLNRAIALAQRAICA